MTDITLHLTANFYPPIPHDIQTRVQEIFDELVGDSGPFILGWADDPGGWDYELEDSSVLDREYTLPNGATVTGHSLLEDLRLWEALWWECEEPTDNFLDSPQGLAYSESKEIPGQLSFWENE